MYQLKVGEPFDGPIPVGGEMAVLELAEGGGFYLLVYLPDMADSEAEHLRKGKMRFRIIRQGDFVHTLVGFGPMQFELPFNPARYSEDRLPDLLKSNMVTVVGVDSRSTLVRALRYVNLPLKLWEIYKRCWAALLGGLISSTDYELWVDGLMQYSLDELWERAEYVGAGGE